MIVFERHKSLKKVHFSVQCYCILGILWHWSRSFCTIVIWGDLYYGSCGRGARGKAQGFSKTQELSGTIGHFSCDSGCRAEESHWPSAVRTTSPSHSRSCFDINKTTVITFAKQINILTLRVKHSYLCGWLSLKWRGKLGRCLRKCLFFIVCFPAHLKSLRAVSAWVQN